MFYDYEINYHTATAQRLRKVADKVKKDSPAQSESLAKEAATNERIAKEVTEIRKKFDDE